MSRQFFIDPALISGDQAILGAEEAAHIRKVLRLAAGDEIALFDGCGGIWQARIVSIGKTSVSVAITSQQTFIRTGPELHLGQALLKGKKMELIAQKATELGLAAIIPFTSAHSDLDDAAESRVIRWHRAVVEAGKQSGNPLLPSISPVTEFSAMLETASSSSYTARIIFSETAATPLADSLTTSGNARVFALIGPEGGFSREEVALAKAHGFTETRLGPLVLRAETAALAAMAIIQYLLGNLGPADLATTPASGQ